MRDVQVTNISFLKYFQSVYTNIPLTSNILRVGFLLTDTCLQIQKDTIRVQGLLNTVE